MSTWHNSWVNIVKGYLDWYSCRPDTEIEDYYSQIVTDQTTRNFLEQKLSWVFLGYPEYF